jgi:hypothetical protein
MKCQFNFPENKMKHFRARGKSFFKKTILVFLFIFSFKASHCLAWTGYDNLDGSEIEIGSGSLVREGEQIKFYDWQSQEDRSAEVIDVEYLFNRTRLEIYDYVTQKNRIFEMGDL